MKKNALEHIIRATLKDILREQDDQAATSIETDNAPSSAKDSPFTPAEERFLGKFDAYGTTHLGIVYSPSITGIREFIIRSGKDLNVTPGILLNLLRKKIIKLVPYTGFGRNDDYTIELQLSLDDVKGLGAADKEAAEKGSTASGGGGLDMGAPEPPASPAEPPAPENAGYVPKGKMIKESLLSENINEDVLDIAVDFWQKISVYLNAYDWKEDEIYNLLKTSLKSRQHAIVIDGLGRLIFDFTQGNSEVASILKKSNLYLSNTPQVPKYGYTLNRLFNNRDFSEYFILGDYPTEMFNLVRTRGIGSFTKTNKSLMQPVKFFPSYTATDIIKSRNEILNYLK